MQAPSFTRRHGQGFSLLEALFAGAIVSVISVMISQTLFQGIKGQHTIESRVGASSAYANWTQYSQLGNLCKDFALVGMAFPSKQQICELSPENKLCQSDVTRTIASSSATQTKVCDPSIQDSNDPKVCPEFFRDFSPKIPPFLKPAGNFIFSEVRFKPADIFASPEGASSAQEFFFVPFTLKASASNTIGGEIPAQRILFKVGVAAKSTSPTGRAIASCQTPRDSTAAPQSGLNIQVFNAAGTFVVPENVSKLVVEVWGGGGGGCPGAGGAGAGGGYAFCSVDVVPGESFQVGVGTGGSDGTSYNSAAICPGATSGGESFFRGRNIDCKATGGTMGKDGGGRGGIGSGGQINLRGQDGEDLYAHFSGRYIAKGGDAPRGGSGGTCWGAGFGEPVYGDSRAYYQGNSPGGGGAANFNGGAGAGAPGAVHIRW